MWRVRGVQRVRGVMGEGVQRVRGVEGEGVWTMEGEGVWRVMGPVWRGETR